MAHRILADFLTFLDDRKDLVRVSAPVDRDCELAAIAMTAATAGADGGPAIMFDAVRGCDIPVAANLLNCRRRLCGALGVESLQSAADRLQALLISELPDGWAESLRLLPRVAQLGSVAPRVVKTGACQQIVAMGQDVDLSQLPVPRFTTDENNPTITSGVLHFVDRDGARHGERHPLEVIGPNRLAVHWHPHHDGYAAHQKYVAESRPMPVAVSLGGDPLLTYASSVSLPGGADALQFTGLLRGGGIDVVRGRSIELDVPADAEFVIEGYIDPADPVWEGGSVPSAWGFSVQNQWLPVINVTAVTHRANPVFPIIVPGRPPTELNWYHKLTERLLVPLLRFYHPEIIDINFPMCGGPGQMLFVSIAKRYPRQARTVLQSLWSLRALMAVKTMVVVDADVDLDDEQSVWLATASHVDPGRDVVVTDGPGDADDHAASVRGVASKLGIDATRKISGEGAVRGGRPTSANSATLEQISSRWQEFGFDFAPPAVRSFTR